MTNTALTEELKINLIKRSISTPEGWRNLAMSVAESVNPNAKQECIDFLKKIGGNKTVPTPTHLGWVDLDFSDLLVSQLEQNILLYNATK